VSEQTTEGEFRVLESTRDREEWLLLNVESADPTYVRDKGYKDDLKRAVETLEPGNRIQAELNWVDGEPQLANVEVAEATRFAFTRTREDLFGDAHGAWRDAEEAGQPMGSRILYGQQGGNPVGVVYVFADQPGQRDLFEEFKDGVKPLDPLLKRLAEAETPPFDVFVVDHHELPFLTVTLAFEQDGVLATTMRETYFGASLFDSGALDVAGTSVEGEFNHGSNNESRE